jgi:hypothetical protein
MFIETFVGKQESRTQTEGYENRTLRRIFGPKTEAGGNCIMRCIIILLE